MIKLSSGSNYSHKYPSQMFGEAVDLLKKPQLPRHISCLESNSYNRPNLIKQQILSACPLSQSPTSDAAWNILKYQLSDCYIQQKHLANLQNNLQRRLSVARVEGNERLVRILQEESRQLQNS